MMKHSKKARILSVVLALMTMVCMAVPAMAQSEHLIYFKPHGGAHRVTDEYGTYVVHCNGAHISHVDPITYTSGSRKGRTAKAGHYSFLDGSKIRWVLTW